MSMLMPTPTPKPMHLALFDLDHTLIPFDSGLAWTEHLIASGVLPAAARDQYLGYAYQYLAGTLDIHAMHRANATPLRHVPRALLASWLREFEAAVAPRVPAAAVSLVRRHLDAGDRCAIVTATTRLIAEPFARLFGGLALLATEAATADGSPGGALTGEIAGEPCYREHKLTHVNRWLAGSSTSGPANIAGFERSWFYSDSISDLTLLSAVTDPVVVRPDQRLRSHAEHAGWPVIEQLI